MEPGYKLDPEECQGIQSILSRIGDKWSVLVVYMLAAGPVRFNDLKRSIDGISQRMLTLTLRSLERDGLISRAVYPTIPPKVEYALTDLGRTLIAPMIGLADWAMTNRKAIEDKRKRFDRKAANA